MDQGPKSYWAEFLGTFTLCFIGQGAIGVQHLLGSGAAGMVSVAIAHGLALAVMVSALASTSGAHFNPAVTLGFVVTGRQSWTSAITYWISQLLGALAASFLLRSVLPGESGQATHWGVPLLGAGVSQSMGLMIELVLTFLLVTAVWGTAVDERAPRIGGLGVGLAYLMGMLFGGPLTGAAMNPARAFGSACASGVWDAHWIYWVGPLLGGAAAARVYKQIVLRP
jgi:MIP family channel proteins